MKYIYKYLPITILLLSLIFFCFHEIAITPTGLYLDVHGYVYDIIKHIECEWIQVDCNE